MRYNIHEQRGGKLTAIPGTKADVDLLLSFSVTSSRMSLSDALLCVDLDADTRTLVDALTGAVSGTGSPKAASGEYFLRGAGRDCTADQSESPSCVFVGEESLLCELTGNADSVDKGRE